MTDELLSVLSTADAVAKGRLSAEKAVHSAIERIERQDPAINAVVSHRFDEALAEAAKSPTSGPLSGVPMLVKDMGVHVRGLPYSAGSKFFAGTIPDKDSLIAQRLKAAGAIIVGATNTPELARLMTTEPDFHGPTHNPWNLGYSPGGSSGGSAAAVSAGMTPAAHASDSGGSIRLPASACGVFGLKPSRGRVPTDMPPNLAALLGADHGITRNVRDSALLLDVLSQPLAGEAITVPLPEEGFLGSLASATGPLRIAISHHTSGDDDEVSADAAAAVKHVATMCEQLGHYVVEDTPDYDLADVFPIAGVLFGTVLVAQLQERAAYLGSDVTQEDLEPFTWFQYEQSRNISAAQYYQALRSGQELSWRLGRFFDDYDVLLTPTMGRPFPPLGHLASGNIETISSEAADFWRFTGVYNITGQPAMSMPLSVSADGMPVGVHAAARYGGESTLFQLASQLEQSPSWLTTAPGYP